MTQNAQCSYQSYDDQTCYYDSEYYREHPKDKPDCCEKCYYYIDDMEAHHKAKQKALDEEMEQLDRELEARAKDDAYKLQYQCNGDLEEARKRLDDADWSDEYKNSIKKYL